MIILKDKIFSDERLDKIEIEFPGIKDCYNEFRKFAIFTHTIGNFTLVPKKYNVCRYAITKDCWDLSLIDLQNKYSIYNWYCDNIDIFLYEDCFNNYRKDVKFKELSVELLFENHSFANKLPKNIIEYIEYLVKVNKRISNRGIKMLKIIN